MTISNPSSPDGISNSVFSNTREAGQGAGGAAPERTAASGTSRAGTGQASTAIRSKQTQAAQLDAIRKSVAFTQIVSLMMRSPHHQQHTLADLEWMFLPALRNDQFKTAEAKSGSINVPAGFVLWAFVSPQVDKRLMESLDAPARLQPEDWRSGDIAWIVDTVGHPQAIRQLLKHCRDTLPRGREAKVRTTSADGITTIAKLADLRIEDQAPTSGG